LGEEMTFNPVPKKKYTKERFFKPKKVAIEKNPLEESEQIALCDWLDVHNICYQASMMGAYLAPATFNRMKRMGCKPGFPDVIIFDQPDIFSPELARKKGVAIELKRRKGGIVSELQKEWQIKLRDRGWISLICEGADNAIKALEMLGYGRRK
jgi:hypothetical protein